MEFDVQDYFGLAKELIQKANQNDTFRIAKIRTVINRAYYSAFLLCREYKNTRGTKDIHQRVINSLTNSNNQTEKDIGKLLDKLRSYRRTADYEIRDNPSKDTAMIAIQLSKQIGDMLQEIVRKTGKD